MQTSPRWKKGFLKPRRIERSSEAENIKAIPNLKREAAVFAGAELKGLKGLKAF